MRIQRIVTLIDASGLCLLSVVLCSPASASQIEDGQVYRAEEAVGAGGATMIFRKEGKEAVGISYTGFWSACYRGSLEANTIRVGGAALQKRDVQTKSFSYEPIPANLRERFVVIPFVNAKPFPNPQAILQTPKAIVERDTLSLTACARYFDSAASEQPTDEIDQRDKAKSLACSSPEGSLGLAAICPNFDSFLVALAGNACAGGVGDFYEENKGILSGPATDGSIETWAALETEYFASQGGCTALLGRWYSTDERVTMMKAARDARPE